MKLTRAQLTRWQEALRDPARKQVKGVLHTSEGQCCLGVFCEIMAESLGLKVDVQENIDGTTLTTYDGDSQVLPYRLGLSLMTALQGPHVLTKHLPLEVFEILKKSTTTSSGKNLDGEPGYSLTALNDAGITFAQIADLLPKAVTIID